MRILNVIDSLSGSGGAERGLVREISRFAGEIDQCVVLLYDRTDLAPRLLDMGIEVEVVGLAEGTGSRKWPKTVGYVRRLAKQFQPDVIQTSLFLGNLVGQIAGRSLRIPTVSNLVLSGDERLLEAYQPGASSRRARLLRAIAGYAARSEYVSFRALTKEVKDTNAALLGVDPDRVTVIARGVPRFEPSPTTREELGLPLGPLVANVGRHGAQKGHNLLIEAFALVKKRVPTCHLVIVGNEGEASWVVRETIRRRSLTDSVVLAGHADSVGDYLTHADVFVFSSLMEGLGTAVLEAMAAGLPIVAFDIPPVRETTADGRFARLVPAGDTAALAQSMVDVLCTQSFDGSKAQQWVQEHHDPDRVAHAVEKLLGEAATQVPR